MGDRDLEPLLGTSHFRVLIGRRELGFCEVGLLTSATDLAVPPEERRHRFAGSSSTSAGRSTRRAPTSRWRSSRSRTSGWRRSSFGGDARRPLFCIGDSPLQIYLPIAELSMNLFFLIGIGGAVGFLSGLFGVGGGFLLTPLLIFSGIPSSVAVASVAGQVVAASTSGSLSYWRRGGIDFHLALFNLLWRTRHVLASHREEPPGVIHLDLTLAPSSRR